MQRRNFMKFCSAAGLSLFAGRSARAAEGAEAPLYACVHASGGWDPTSLCDPKGAESAEAENPMNRYLASDIGQSGTLRWAPIPGAQAFFDKHYKRLLVVNGIDTATNGHDSGVRHVWSGKLIEGYPAFAALAAAPHVELPMAFLSSGGYDHTAGLVAPTRVGHTDVLARLAYPNRPDPKDAERAFHAPHAASAIDRYRRERLLRVKDRVLLPRLVSSVRAFENARSGTSEIQLLSKALPEQLDNGGNPLIRQSQLAVAAFESGLAVSANLVIGGFDTHGNHDDSHFPRLGQLMEGVDALWSLAEARGIAHRLTIIVGSDFGRTPGYNDGNGKDHWTVGSMLILSPEIPGDRVIGATDDTFRHKKLDLGSLEVGGADALKLGHVHKWLRKFAGIADHPIVRRYPISVKGELDLG